MKLNNTAQGLLWSTIERFSVQGIQFVLSIFIARILSPSDYGLIAMLSLFLGLAQCLIDSGFSNALIQKQERRNVDYSTAFMVNIVIGLLMYVLLFLLSPLIASFYKQIELEAIIKILGLNLIIISFSSVLRTKLIIDLNFKKQAFISFSSIIISGFIAVWMAYLGYGVWVLVIQSLCINIVDCFLFWVTSSWHPSFSFSISSFRGLFKLGSRILLGGILHSIYTNMYSLIIGKKFLPSDLGYYNRASSSALFFSDNITNIIARVAYPMECQLQNQDEKLQEKYFIFIRISAFILFPILVGLLVLAEPLIKCILTEKWLLSVPYLQILCLANILAPVMRLSSDLLNVKGRGDYFLKAEIQKKIIAFSILIITIQFGIKSLCWGLLLYSFIDIFTTTKYLNKILPCISFLKVLKAVFPFGVISTMMGFIIFCIITFLETNFLKLFIGFVGGVISYLFFSVIFRVREFSLIRSFLFNRNHKL